jgi:hypothetical protein
MGAYNNRLKPTEIAGLPLISVAGFLLAVLTSSFAMMMYRNHIIIAIFAAVAAFVFLTAAIALIPLSDQVPYLRVRFLDARERLARTFDAPDIE